MEKILVIQTAFIGDAILTLPMIKALKEKFTGCALDVLAIPSTADIFNASPYIDNVEVIDKRGKQKSFFSLIGFTSRLRKNNYTRVYSPHRSFRTSFIAMNLNVRETYGFSNSSFKYVYKHLIDYNPSHHEVRRNLDLAGFDYNGEGWRILPEIKAPEESVHKVNAFISQNSINGKFAVIAPGSVWNTKKYPAEYFAEIIKYLTGSSYKVILIGSAVEKNLCKEIERGAGKGVYIAAGEFSLIETAELIKRSEILICNDSAPTHLGMSAGVPVITLYCSTVPEFGFYPYSENSAYLRVNGLKCKPCGIHGHERCPIKTFECGYRLDPQIVISKIKEMLND